MMYGRDRAGKENENRSVAGSAVQKKNARTGGMELVDNRGLSPMYFRLTKVGLSSTMNSFNGVSQLVSIKEVRPQKAMITGSPKAVGDRKKAGCEKHAPAVDTLGRDPATEIAGDYGLTWPQRLRIEFDVKKFGDVWKPQLKGLIGEYSRQATLMGHQTDVTSANQATTALEATQIISAFDDLGVPSVDHNWYSLAAVESHEAAHAYTILSALTDKQDEIAALIEAIAIPIATSANEQNAITTIRALPAFDLAVRDSFQLWDNRWDDLIKKDHVPGGKTELAEKRITNPIKGKIKEKQVERRWLPRPPMVDLF